jgi:predicted short-subunit dehydrogenase-like oxidoreductase (DUF2520 family)
MIEKPDVTIAGPGALGSTLIKTLELSGFSVRSVISRKTKPKLGSDYQHLTVTDYKTVQPEHIGKIVFITTPDDVINEVAERLSQLHIKWSDKMVAHCSGFLTSDILMPIKVKGGSVAAFHPLQTFVEQSDVTAFHDIMISIEGDKIASSFFDKFVLELGGKPLHVNQQQKRILHIAAVFMSNYVVSLGAISDTLVRENIPGMDFKLLFPLLKSTVQNLMHSGPVDALSGPIARGDIETIGRHLEELEDNDPLLTLYKLLGSQTLRIAVKKGNADSENLSEIRKLLEVNPD